MSNTIFTDVKDITIKGKAVRSIHNASTGRTIWEKEVLLNTPLKFERRTVIEED